MASLATTSRRSRPAPSPAGVLSRPRPDAYRRRAPRRPDLLDPTAANQPPVANAGANQAVNVGQTVQLNGSASTDPEGALLTYSWTLPTRPAGSTAALTNPTTVNPTFTPDAAGAYIAQLVVNDGTQNSAPASVTITAATPAQNLPPVANAGPDQAVNVGQTVALNGSGSTDPESQPLTYAWSFVSRPTGSAAALAGATTVNPTFVADAAGSYTVQLIVNDGQANSPPDTVVVTTGNLPPVANAGPDQAVNVGQTVTLNGSGSSDPNADPLTYAWSFVSRPTGSAAALAGATTVNPTFVADAAGSYTVQLIVNDGQANSPPDTVVVTTGNLPPVANAGPDQAVNVGQTVTLNGSGSSDPNANPLTYAWSFVSRPTGSAAALSNVAAVNPTFVADVAGSYTVQLIVNDGQVNSPPDTVIIAATASNLPPTANAGPDQTVTVATTVTLDGSASSDPEGRPLTYRWFFVSQPAGSPAVLENPTTAKPFFTPALVGSYVVGLVVNDGTLDSTQTNVVITAQAFSDGRRRLLHRHGGVRVAPGPAGPNLARDPRYLPPPVRAGARAGAGVLCREPGAGRRHRPLRDPPGGGAGRPAAAGGLGDAGVVVAGPGVRGTAPAPRGRLAGRPPVPPALTEASMRAHLPSGASARVGVALTPVLLASVLLAWTAPAAAASQPTGRSIEAPSRPWRVRPARRRRRTPRPPRR